LRSAIIGFFATWRRRECSLTAPKGNPRALASLPPGGRENAAVPYSTPRKPRIAITSDEKEQTSSEIGYSKYSTTTGKEGKYCSEGEEGRDDLPRP